MFIPDRLNELMDARNITAYKISKAIGCSNSSIANWRNGLVSPDSENIRKLSEFFGVSMAYFFDKEPATPEKEQPATRRDELMNELRDELKDRSVEELERDLDVLRALRKK